MTVHDLEAVRAERSMSNAAARALTDKLKADAENLWRGLLDAYERGVHTALGYGSWAAYCKTEFGASTSRAYRLLDAGRVAKAIHAHSPTGERVPLKSERTARELVPVLREKGEKAVAETWAEVVEEHGPQPTAEEARTIVKSTKDRTKNLTREQREFENNLSGMALGADYVINQLRGRSTDDRQTTTKLVNVDAETWAVWQEHATSIARSVTQLRRYILEHKGPGYIERSKV